MKACTRPPPDPLSAACPGCFLFRCICYNIMISSPLFRIVVSLISLGTFGTSLPNNIWNIDILQSPAPPRESGPPLSANNLRDTKYLPLQIGGIAGAYLIWLIFVGTALVIVGRNLRRKAQSSPKTLAMEMMRPGNPDVSKDFDPSPISPPNRYPYGKSPASTVDTKELWPSPEKSRIGFGWGKGNRGHSKQTSMQSSVVTISEDVVEDHRARAQEDMERLYAAVMEQDEKRSLAVQSTRSSQQTQVNPPEFQHLRGNTLTSQPPMSPTLPDAPKFEGRTTPRKSNRPTPIATTVSRGSSRSSVTSHMKMRQGNFRDLPISPPMGSPELVPDFVSMYGESEPLSPRLYEPGPPPLTPPAREARAQAQRMEATRLPSRLAETHDAPPQTSIPSRQPPSHEYSGRKRTPAPLSLKTGHATQGSSGSLPLRSAPLPLRAQPGAIRPPSMIKATVIESKPRHLGPGAPTPRTGVPMTPYSPYMPFTPLTPMTPSRLVTRAERKQKAKEEGRRVLTEIDRVEEEGDMWGDAYA